MPINVLPVKLAPPAGMPAVGGGPEPSSGTRYTSTLPPSDGVPALIASWMSVIVELEATLKEMASGPAGDPMAVALYCSVG